MIVPIGEEETIYICTSTPNGSIREIEDFNIIKKCFYRCSLPEVDANFTMFSNLIFKSNIQRQSERKKVVEINTITVELLNK